MSLLKESLIEAVKTLEEVEKETGVKLLTSGDIIISLAQTIYNNTSKDKRTQDIAKEKQARSAVKKDEKASPKQITKLRSMLKGKIKGRKEQDQYLLKIFDVNSLDKITNQMAWPVINENALPQGAPIREVSPKQTPQGTEAGKTTNPQQFKEASPKQIAYLRHMLSEQNIKNTKKQDEYLLKFFKIKNLGQISKQSAWQAINKNLLAARGGVTC